jgi:hypothetical protein
VDLILKALDVDSAEKFQEFHKVFVPATQEVKDGRAKIMQDPWQQFVVHARDSHGYPITDYALSIVAKDAAENESELTAFEEDVHPFTADPSYRCFHVRLNELMESTAGKKLSVRIVASTGTDMVGYQGYGSNAVSTGVEPTIGPVDLDISKYQGDEAGQPSLFYPFTTTLVEVILNREPIPQKDGSVEIFGFLAGSVPAAK